MTDLFNFVNTVYVSPVLAFPIPMDPFPLVSFAPWAHFL